MAASEGAKRPAAFVEDTAVAPERLGDYVKAFRAILERHGLNAGFYGHCSVGCLHIRPFVDLTAPGGVETMAAVADEIAELVAEFDGVNSSEHGDGRVRSPFNPRVFGDELYAAIREVKALFDPDGRMNPGVMVDAAPLTVEPARPRAAARAAAADALLLRRRRRCAPPPTAASGSAPAARSGQGVMCPSYMATREEEHATRGRANALVKALSEPDPRAALGDERLHEILDLCLECKACKSECPLSVDMATMKSEFLSHYQAQHGVPLRSRLFGAIRRLNRLGSATAPRQQPPDPARAARARGGHRPPPAAPALRARDAAALGRSGARRGAATRRRRLPGRLVHHLHRARDRARRDRAAGGRGLERAARERRLLRALEHLQGPARPGAGDGGGDGRAAGARGRARRPDRRLRAVVPADAARGAPRPAGRRRRARRPSRTPRGSSRSCSSRRSTTAR